MGDLYTIQQPSDPLQEINKMLYGLIWVKIIKFENLFAGELKNLGKTVTYQLKCASSSSYFIEGQCFLKYGRAIFHYHYDANFKEFLLKEN